MTAEQKIKLIKEVFTRLFNNKPAPKPFRSMTTLAGLRKAEAKIAGDHIMIIEQNPRKTSWCGKLAVQGYKLAWVFKNGNYSALVIEIGGQIRIINAKDARSKVTLLLKEASKKP